MKRVIGTTETAIQATEAGVGFSFPPSFRAWLFQNNGLSLEDVWIFPVYDERDPRKTWDSIVRQYDKGQWGGEVFEDESKDFSHLLPFASYGTGDFYCFDYSHKSNGGEMPVVRWSHETGETEGRGRDFTDFCYRLQQGDFEYD